MENIRFNHETHRRFYHRMLRRSGQRKIPAACALFYVLGIGKETRNHIDELYDWEQRTIRPDALYAHWQTDQSICTTLFAFHLCTGYTAKTYAHLLTPHALLSGNFAPLYIEALKLRYPELFGCSE